MDEEMRLWQVYFLYMGRNKIVRYKTGIRATANIQSIFVPLGIKKSSPNYAFMLCWLNSSAILITSLLLLIIREAPQRIGWPSILVDFCVWTFLDRKLLFVVLVTDF